jgi:hypothetical protein
MYVASIISRKTSTNHPHHNIQKGTLGAELQTGSYVRKRYAMKTVMD